MGNIVLYPASSRVLTGEDGTASVCLRVPGTFNGNDGFSEPPSDGRYLREIQVWTEDGTGGDQVKNIRIEDDLKVLGAAAVLFKDYPVIQNMADVSATGEGISDGLIIPMGRMITLGPIDSIQNRGLRFIPAEVSLCFDVVAGDGASGRAFCANYLWGKYFP